MWPMLGGAVANVGVNALTSYLAGNAQEKAAKQASAANQAAIAAAMNYMKPWTQSGQKAQVMYDNGLGLNGADGNAAAVGAFHTSPGYNFTKSEGIRALDSSASREGMVFSGGAAKDLARFGSGLADQEYGSWLDRLARQSNQGLSAATTTAGLQTQQGQAIADGIYGAADARSNMYGNMGASVNNGINSAGTIYQAENNKKQAQSILDQWAQKGFKL